MSVLDDLLLDVKDVALRERLQKEIARLGERKKFGLVFENHIPECTALYDVPVRKGSLAATKQGEPEGLLTVIGTDGDVARVIPTGTDEVFEVPLSNLISMARFGDPIFPALAPVDSIEADPESPLWHSLIEADNYHALQLLEYLYAGKVDCIYIDPPYNTGARDWKYNNDFVDSNDVYRHSKWLSMMERRLKIAKTLLNPRDSVLIVTIDDNEVHHLYLLLQELFVGCNIQTITSVINPSGKVGSGFSMVHEYVLVVYIGSSGVSNTEKDMLFDGRSSQNTRDGGLRWESLLRRGSSWNPKARPHLFYPVLVDERTQRIVGVGSPQDPGDRLPTTIDGSFAAWPIKRDGSYAIWRVAGDRLLEYANEGFAYVSGFDKRRGTYAMHYLLQGDVDKIRAGEVKVNRDGKHGEVTLVEELSRTKTPKTVWNDPTHNAGVHGSDLLSRVIGERRFSYPKSLYAVVDTLRFFVSNKPNALVVDFFAGSGTTLHAVNLLNHEDGGHRRCVLITNNEVSNSEADSLEKSGFNRGDDEWEQFGVARYVTWPRTVCSIEGRNLKGDPIPGTYLDTGEPMADGLAANAEFFKLTFLDRDSVELGEQFREILPLLWLRAGAVGPRPVVPDGDLPRMLIPERSNFAVLIDDRAYTDFRRTVNGLDIDHVFIVTDSDVAFQEMASRLTAGEVVQLYRDYLDNFVINGRSAV